MLRRAVCAAVEAAPRLATVGDVAMTRNIRWIPNGAVARVTTRAGALDKLGKPPEDNGAAARRAEVRRVTVILPRDPLSRCDPYNDLEVHGCPLSHLSPPKPQLNPPLLSCIFDCPRRPNASRRNASRHGAVLYSPTWRSTWTMIGSSPDGQTPSSSLASSWCSVLPGGTLG